MATKIDHIEANIGINEDNKQAITDKLNRLLSNEFVLCTKTRKYHWNVEGAFFKSLHIMFEEQYKELSIIIDEIAERIRKLGHFAIGSLKQFTELTDLVELDGLEPTDARQMLIELCDDHETLIRIIRAELNVIGTELKDAGTEDFLTGIMEQHETIAWMLRVSAK